MKMKRFLSWMLASVLTLALAAAFPAPIFAEDPPEGLTVSLGHAWAPPGGTAFIEISVSAKSLPAGYERLRDWQFSFSGASVTTQNSYFVSDDSAGVYPFVNQTNNQIGATVGTGAWFASTEQVLAKGGAHIATIGFSVPEDAEGEIAVFISSAESLSFENADLVSVSGLRGEITLVPGKITVVKSVSGTTAPHKGGGEDYRLPAFAEEGTVRISSMLDEKGDPALTGSFGILTVPAGIGDVADGFEGIDELKGVVLRGTSLDKEAAKAIAKKGSVDSPVQVFVLYRPNGADTTAAAFEELSASDRAKVQVKGLLKAYTQVIREESGALCFVGGIAACDLGFDALTLEVTFDGERTFVSEQNRLYKTLTGVASTDGRLAQQNGVAFADGFFALTGVRISHVPEGAHTVTVTVYATEENANGNNIVVCGKTVEINA